MNRKEKVRVLSYGLTAGALAAVAGPALTSQAAPVAGAAAAIQTNISEDQNGSIAGASRILADTMQNVESKNTEEAAEKEVAVREEAVEEAAYQARLQKTAIAQVDDYVNVRAGADENTEAVGKLYDKNFAKVLEKKDGWVKLKSGNLTGYVQEDAVAVGDEAAIRDAGTTVATVDADSLYVRNGTSADSEVIDTVSSGNDLTVSDDEKNGWVKVSSEGGEGYVPEEYVDITTSYTYGETAEEEQKRLASEQAAQRAAAEAAAQRTAAAAAATARETTQSHSGPVVTNRVSTSAPEVVAQEKKMIGNGSAVAGYACRFVGNPYVWGGTSLTRGTDCSGFVMSVYSHFGISLPHSSAALRNVGRSVSHAEMQPGDIVCYSGHVGIYIGNGTLVHASNPRSGIKFSNVDYRTILAIRRVF